MAKAACKGGMTQKEVRSGLNALIESLVEAFENDTDVAIARLGFISLYILLKNG